MYRLNLITNDGLIDHHQKDHRDYQVKFPKTERNIEMTKIFNINLYISYKHIIIFNIYNKKIL